MRHELCLDNRNEPKWRVALKAADRVDACAVIYAAMFVPDIGEDGNQRDSWPECDASNAVEVQTRDFYTAERLYAQRLNPGRNNPAGDLWRIVHLDSRIKPVRTQYHWDQQASYVQDVVATVNQHRTADRSVAVLLDPCNGIAATRHQRSRVRHLRVSPSAIATIWTNLRAGDVLVIWQYPLPDRIRHSSDTLALLAAALQRTGRAPVGGIQVHPFGPFVMLEILR